MKKYNKQNRRTRLDILKARWEKFGPKAEVAFENGDLKKYMFFQNQMESLVSRKKILECRLNFFAKDIRRNKRHAEKLLRECIRRGYYQLAVRITEVFCITITSEQEERVITKACKKEDILSDFLFSALEKISPELKVQILEKKLSTAINFAWHEIMWQLAKKNRKGFIKI